MVSNEANSVSLDTYGDQLARNDPLALGLKNELKRYFLDSLRKLETMLKRNEFKKYGYPEHYLRNTVIETLQKNVDQVNERFPGANSISFKLEHMHEIQ